MYAGDDDAFTQCPDCHQAVVPMTSNAPPEKRKDAIILHRLTACPKSAHILDWFHSAALRSVPEAGMLRALAPARMLHDISAAPAPDTPGCPTRRP
jgi:hypothetical protein